MLSLYFRSFAGKTDLDGTPSADIWLLDRRALSIRMNRHDAFPDENIMRTYEEYTNFYRLPTVELPSSELIQVEPSPVMVRTNSVSNFGKAAAFEPSHRTQINCYQQMTFRDILTISARNLLELSLLITQFLNILNLFFA